MTRRRRSATEARRQILDAAEKRLAEGGPESIRVQDVAEQLGVVPATILHHFGSRERLLTELMIHGSRKLEGRLAELVAAARPDLTRLSVQLFELYASRGYAALYTSLSHEPTAGDAGSPAFTPLLERLQETRRLGTRKLREQAAYAVLVLNLIAFADALVGRPMRQAVGLPDDEANRARFGRWVGRLLDDVVSAE